MIFTVGLASFMFKFLSISAQDACEWYYWEPTDWPDGSTQDFEALLADNPDYTYLGQSDFEEGGDYGQTWEDVFWTGVNDEEPPDASFRPLGFRYAKLGAWNDPTVCLRAWNVTGYKVELMVYTLTPKASLCIQDMSADAYNQQDTGAVTACDSQYIYNCFTADTDHPELEVSVYCDTNCEDMSNIHMLWRFRRSGLTWEDSREFSSQNPEMWCDMIASDINWPDEIEEAIPDQYEAVDNISSANAISMLFASLFVGVLALLN